MSAIQFCSIVQLFNCFLQLADSIVQLFHYSIVHLFLLQKFKILMVYRFIRQLAAILSVKIHSLLSLIARSEDFAVRGNFHSRQFFSYNSFAFIRPFAAIFHSVLFVHSRQFFLFCLRHFLYDIC